MMDTLNPLERLDVDAQRKLLVGSFILFLVLSIVLTIIARPLTTPAAPLGIVSIELAGTAARAEEIFASWSDRARGAFLLVQGLDYLYLLVYPVMLSLACLAAARRREDGIDAPFGSGRRNSRANRRVPWPPHEPLAVLGRYVAFAVLISGILDGIENYALILLLAQQPTDRWAGLAWWAASGKFALLAVGLAYLLAARVIPRRKSAF